METVPKIANGQYNYGFNSHAFMFSNVNLAKLILVWTISYFTNEYTKPRSSHLGEKNFLWANFVRCIYFTEIVKHIDPLGNAFDILTDSNGPFTVVESVGNSESYK